MYGTVGSAVRVSNVTVSLHVYIVQNHTAGDPDAVSGSTPLDPEGSYFVTVQAQNGYGIGPMTVIALPKHDGKLQEFPGKTYMNTELQFAVLFNEIDYTDSKSGGKSIFRII